MSMIGHFVVEELRLTSYWTNWRPCVVKLLYAITFASYFFTDLVLVHEQIKWI